MTRMSPLTPALLASIKAECAEHGATVRLRKLSGSLRGTVRLVLTAGSRDQVRDAMVMIGARSSTNTAFTSPDVRHCWNGDQINLFIPA